MRKLLKSCYKLLSDLVATIVSLLSVLFFSRYKRENLSKCGQFIKDKERILILGNGPTLGSCIERESEHFKSCPLMVVNNFFNSTLLTSLKPHYYIFCDPAYYRKDVDNYDYNEIEAFVKFLNEVDWDLNIIMPVEFYNSFAYKRIHNHNLHYFYINLTPVSGFASVSHLFYKRNLGMPLAQNILNAAIFSAINMGFKNIELYGADHSWTKDVRVNKNNETCMRDGHFYDEEDNLRVMPGFDMTSLLSAFSKAFNSHKLLQRYAVSRGVNIINCTPGSFVDAYKRKEGC